MATYHLRRPALETAESAQSDGPLSAARETMRILRCRNCGTLLAPQTSKCSSCGDVELESVGCSGAGSIVSWKVLHPTVRERHAEPSPFTLAIVELDDGPWVYSRIEGTFSECADAPVRVEFRPAHPAGGFPVFGVCAA